MPVLKKCWYIYFFISPWKHMMWLLVRTASMRCFRWVPTTRFYGEIRRIFFRLPLFSEAMGVYYFHKTSLITKICLFKYTEHFTTKKWNFSDKKFWFFFHISAQNIDCRYSLELPQGGSSNEYPQSMFLGRNKKNNVFPCKPQFYYIKVGFKGVKTI